MSSTAGPFWRAFPAQIERVGRDLTGRLVPYDVSTDVLDWSDGKPELYREGFRRGAFSPQASSTSRGVIAKVSLIHRHEGGLGYLGPFTALREAADGLYGTARIMPTHEENVETLLDSGVRELSVEFRLRGADHTKIDDDGVRWRQNAHLDQVALEPKGAYSTAQVLAYRAEVDDHQREQADEQSRLEAEERERAETEEAERLAAEAEVAAAAEAEERRKAWAELTDRLPATQAKQEQLVREYGVTQPGGLGSRIKGS